MFDYLIFYINVNDYVYKSCKTSETGYEGTILYKIQNTDKISIVITLSIQHFIQAMSTNKIKNFLN